MTTKELIIALRKLAPLMGRREHRAMLREAANKLESLNMELNRIYKEDPNV